MRAIAISQANSWYSGFSGFNWLDTDYSLENEIIQLCRVAPPRMPCVAATCRDFYHLLLLLLFDLLLLLHLPVYLLTALLPALPFSHSRFLFLVAAEEAAREVSRLIS